MAPHSYSYQIAKNALNDNDKNRLLAVFLNCDPATANWDKASRDFGSASVESMKAMVRIVLKKVEAAGGKEFVESNPEKTTKTPVSGKGKRKTKASNEDGDDVEETPSKNKKASKPEKEEAEEEDGVDVFDDVDGEYRFKNNKNGRNRGESEINF